MFLTDEQVKDRLEKGGAVLERLARGTPLAPQPAPSPSAESFPEIEVGEDITPSPDSPADQDSGESCSAGPLFSPPDVELLEAEEAPQAALVTHVTRRGRGKGIPADERVLLGAASQILGPTVAGEIFDVSPSTAYAAGAGTMTKKDAQGNTFAVPGADKELLKRIESTVGVRKAKILDAALDGMLASVEFCRDNPSSKKAAMVSKTALNLSRIQERVEGRRDKGGPQVQFVVYAPTLQQENTYNTLEVD